MAYVVLARKWRPQGFDDLVGQEHVSRTLANAIATDRVAHAFLFTGVRGVGKTTSARILAKALNCEQGPTAKPCLKCSACVEIGEGSNMDVHEIDGASYNGVDEVRKLQESLPYRPSRDRFKIYIVDEVHMLSKPAWNAFLKTLEEPPPHVKFIFATTEVDKVPITILSRCQRYDFKLIGIDAIAKRLREVLEKEDVKADEEALRIVAREAAGSMRDAMSLLDQVIAWIGGSGETLTAEGVARVLGVASRSVLHNIGAAVLGGQPARCIEIVGALAEQGFSLGNVARDLLRYLRDLVVASVSDEPSRLIDLADAELGELVTLAKTTTSEDLSRLYLGFSRSFDDIVRSSQPRGALEMALVRLSQRPPLLPLDELLRKLAAMEKRLAGGGGPAAGGAAGAGHSNRGGAGPIPGGPRAQATSSPQPVPPPPQPPPSQGPPAPAAASPPPPQPAPPPPQPPPSQGPSAPAPAVTPAPAPAARRPPAKKEDKPLFTPPARFAAAAAATPTSSGKAPSPAAAAAGRGPAQRPPAVTAHPFEHVTNKHVSAPPPGSAAAVAPAAAARNAEQVKEWQTLLNRFPAEKKHIAGYFQQAAPLAVAADGVTIAFAATAEFAAQQVNNNDAMHLLQTAVNEHFGAVTAVTIVADADLRGMQTVTEKLALEKQLRIDQARQQVAQHPVVLAAMEVLGAELRDVRLPAATGAP